jgi:hypothetical protein
MNMLKMFYNGCCVWIHRILAVFDSLKNAKYIQDSVINKLPVTNNTDINQCLQEKEKWSTKITDIISAEIHVMINKIKMRLDNIIKINNILPTNVSMDLFI